MWSSLQCCPQRDRDNGRCIYILCPSVAEMPGEQCRPSQLGGKKQYLPSRQAAGGGEQGMVGVASAGSATTSFLIFTDLAFFTKYLHIWNKHTCPISTLSSQLLFLPLQTGLIQHSKYHMRSHPGLYNLLHTEIRQAWVVFELYYILHIYCHDTAQYV